MSDTGQLQIEDAHAIPEDHASLSEPMASPLPQIADTFARTEDKYLVPHHLYQFFLDQLQEHMLPSYPIPGTEYTFIESLYYDSTELRFFQDHFQRLPLRYKLRTRRYGPNGRWQVTPPHLELKSKQQKVSRKERFRIADEDLRYLIGGEFLTLTSSLREVNQEMAETKLRTRIEKVNAILGEVAPRPLCAVRYVRRAFEQDGIRVTMDNSIRTELIGCLSSDTVDSIYEGPLWNRIERMGRKIRNDSHFLLEVKHNGTTLDWLDELVQAYELRDTRFSKYCYAVTGFLAAHRGVTL